MGIYQIGHQGGVLWSSGLLVTCLFCLINVFWLYKCLSSSVHN